jgi:ribosomal protein L37E
MQQQLVKQKKFINCRNCSYQFDPTKEGNPKKRKCEMCGFGDSYSIRSKREYERNLMFAIIKSLQ